MTSTPADSSPRPTPSSSTLTIADLGEVALIERIRVRAPEAPPWVLVGIGDDAAVIAPGRNTLDVVTVDALVEGVHFDWRFTSAGDVGFKALAVNLSDLAAMGATPRAAILSLAVPGTLAVAQLDDLVSTFLALAEQHRMVLLGGNVSRSPGPLFIDVTALGAVKRRQVLTRAGARPGDELYLSGTVGGAAAGLERLRANGTDALASDTITRYRRPEPRVKLGVLVGRNRAARACVDLSDGLGDAAHQLATASGVGVVLNGEAIPVHADARAWCEGRGIDPLQAALTGGEDYELLFAVPPTWRRRFTAITRLVRDLPVTQIGVVTADPETVVRRGNRIEPLPRGFAHF